MKHDPFCNWVTNDAIWCVDALVRLGEPRESLSIYYQMLKTHSSMGSQAQQWLGEHFEKCNVPSRDVLEN